MMAVRSWYNIMELQRQDSNDVKMLELVQEGSLPGDERYC